MDKTIKDKIDVCKNCECSETAHPYGDLYCDVHKKTCDAISKCISNPYMDIDITQENKHVNMTATEAGFPEHEPVKNPSHYTDQVPGIECIQVTQHFNFNRGNIIEYAWRCGDKGDAIQDLEKVIQYAKFEIERLKNV